MLGKKWRRLFIVIWSNTWQKKTWQLRKTVWKKNSLWQSQWLNLFLLLSIKELIYKYAITWKLQLSWVPKSHTQQVKAHSITYKLLGRNPNVRLGISFARHTRGCSQSSRDWYSLSTTGLCTGMETCTAFQLHCLRWCKVLQTQTHMCAHTHAYVQLFAAIRIHDILSIDIFYIFILELC